MSEDYRLTEEDEDRMRLSLRRAWAEGFRNTDGTLERLAAHAVSCSLYDLRDCERQWITNEIGELEMGL